MSMRFSLTVGAMVAGMGVGLVVGSPTLVLALPAAVGCSRHWRTVSGRAVSRGRAGDATIEVVQELIQQLKGGRSLAQALGAVARPSGPGRSTLGPAGWHVVGSPGPVLARLRAALDAGTGLELALARAAGWGPGRATVGTGGSPAVDPGLALTLATLRVLVHRGGPALPALERLDDTLRSVQWVEQETRVQSSQATASALALVGLPGLFAAALALLEPDLAHFYAFEALGAVCLVSAGLLSYLGWWWMHRVIWRRS